MTNKYFELILNKNDESMCIAGTRQPTVEEAARFIAVDLETVFESSKVIDVRELTADEASKFYDVDDLETMAVFHG